MIIRSADFMVSNVDPGKCPKPDKPEFAFIGRSNVGKSSLINLLVNQKKLAKISSTPGKTQTINHFLINETWYLVDLPGYGFANTGKKNKGAWLPMIETYLTKRTNLLTTFVLIDPRHEPQNIDLEFIQWMGGEGIPFSLVFTKIDKISKNELMRSKKIWEERLGQTWEEFPIFFFTSAESKLGREELLQYLDKLVSGKSR